MLPLFDNIPTRRVPVVTYALLGACFGVWFWELGARSGRIDHYAFYPCAVDGPCTGSARDHLAWPEGVLTGMFLHASWLHILGNMLFLWIFANNVEDAFGRFRFLGFYLVAGYVAALSQAWVTLHFGGVDAASVPNVGASGAIAGVLGAYFVLYPHARVTTLLFGLPAMAAVGDGLPRLLVRPPALGERIRAHAPGLRRRRGVRGARRRLRLRRADGAAPARHSAVQSRPAG
jgi:membrane associated rhomboid family serine protease